MAMQVGERGSLNAEPNVVPMIDILLVLLIIFMIVTPVIAAGFPAQMPMARHIELRQEEGGDVVLGIDRDGKFYLDPGIGQTGLVPEGQLEQVLTQIYDARTENKILYFKADQNLEFAKVQEGIEIARKAGVRVIAAVTEELRERRGILGGGD
jgi:biopolymer transport protein ExbD